MGWLIESVNDRKGQSYDRLLKILYQKEFYSLINYDENRAKDGIHLRDIWQSANNLSEEDIAFGVSKVLEVLIGISKRVWHEICGSKWAEQLRPSDIFWILLENLGLEKFLDEYLAAGMFEEINEILLNWVERRYERNGLGGIFPVMRASKNMRNLELWDQMSLYIHENWPI